MAARDPPLKVKRTVIGVIIGLAQTPKNLLQCTSNLLVGIWEESLSLFERLPAKQMASRGLAKMAIAYVCGGTLKILILSTSKNSLLFFFKYPVPWPQTTFSQDCFLDLVMRRVRSDILALKTWAHGKTSQENRLVSV